MSASADRRYPYMAWHGPVGATAVCWIGEVEYHRSDRRVIAQMIRIQQKFVTGTYPRMIRIGKPNRPVWRWMKVPA